MFQVVVLNDGETYTALEGCVILEIPESVDAESDDLDYYVKDNYKNGTPITGGN